MNNGLGKSDDIGAYPVTTAYSPDDFDINSRAVVVSLQLKMTDAVLYNKMAYDPANGAAWLASMFKSADFQIPFLSDVMKISLKNSVTLQVLKK